MYSLDRLPPKWRARPIREVIADTDGLKVLHDQIRRKIVTKTLRKTGDLPKKSNPPVPTPPRAWSQTRLPMNAATAEIM
jgi:hypothetical protein